MVPSLLNKTLPQECFSQSKKRERGWGGGWGGYGEFGTSVEPLMWRSHIKCMWLKFVHFHYSNRLEIRDKTGIWQWWVILCFQNVSSSKRHYYYFFKSSLLYPVSPFLIHLWLQEQCHLLSQRRRGGTTGRKSNAHHSSLQCSIEILKRCSSSGEATPLAEPSLSPL